MWGSMGGWTVQRALLWLHYGTDLASRRYACCQGRVDRDLAAAGSCGLPSPGCGDSRALRRLLDLSRPRYASLAWSVSTLAWVAASCIAINMTSGRRRLKQCSASNVLRAAASSLVTTDQSTGCMVAGRR
jgi:hypothetical protein